MLAETNRALGSDGGFHKIPENHITFSSPGPDFPREFSLRSKRAETRVGLSETLASRVHAEGAGWGRKKYLGPRGGNCRMIPDVHSLTRFSDGKPQHRQSGALAETAFWLNMKRADTAASMFTRNPLASSQLDKELLKDNIISCDIQMLPRPENRHRTG